MTKAAGTEPFSLRPVPEVHFGAGRVAAIAEDAAALNPTGDAVVLVADAALHELGITGKVVDPLRQAGAAVEVFIASAREPKEDDVEAATDFVRSKGAGLVIAFGGGSAMDIGKMAATVARTEQPAADFAMEGDPLPRDRVPKICIPTTAGTGSELSSTNIFTATNGKKVWIWGSETKPERVILDPGLTVTLPPHLTAWTGLDAFVHALESCTNLHRHAANDIYSHHALGLITGSLETAVAEPGNLEARGAMLLGSAYAGMAIDNCSAGMAHNISHSLAALAPINHGLATALGLEVVLGWQAERDDGPCARAAAACGLSGGADELAPWYSGFLDRLGIERRLPDAFAGLGATDLAREMFADETSYMRLSSRRTVADTDLERFAAEVMAMAPQAEGVTP